MAKLVYGLNQSLDGFIDHTGFAPDAVLFKHFIELVRGLSGSVYGRETYEVLRYWDEDQPDWPADHRAFAQAWRAQPKWVASRTLQSVGPNATLVSGDIEGVVRKLKEELPGQIEVGGPALAQSLTDAGLIDEYQIYLHPVVVGAGKRFFAGATPPLRLTASERIGEAAIRLTYAPA